MKWKSLSLKPKLRWVAFNFPLYTNSCWIRAGSGGRRAGLANQPWFATWTCKLETKFTRHFKLCRPEPTVTSKLWCERILHSVQSSCHSTTPVWAGYRYRLENKYRSKRPLEKKQATAAGSKQGHFSKNSNYISWRTPLLRFGNMKVTRLEGQALTIQFQ